MASKTQRVTAGLAALFFLITSLSASVAVIWVLVSQHNKKSNNQQTGNNVQQQQPQANPLVGQKLQNFTPSSDPVTQLQITDSKVGDGAEAKAGSTVSVIYVGALVKDGTIFDASQNNQPASLSLSQVIKGWQDGIPGMKVGGTRRLVIPAAQAYGDQSPSASIPANSDLVFDVTLVAVQ